MKNFLQQKSLAQEKGNTIYFPVAEYRSREASIENK